MVSASSKRSFGTGKQVHTERNSTRNNSLKGMEKTANKHKRKRVLVSKVDLEAQSITRSCPGPICNGSQ